MPRWAGTGRLTRFCSFPVWRRSELRGFLLERAKCNSVCICVHFHHRGCPCGVSDYVCLDVLSLWTHQWSRWTAMGGPMRASSCQAHNRRAACGIPLSTRLFFVLYFRVTFRQFAIRVVDGREGLPSRFLRLHWEGVGRIFVVYFGASFSTFFGCPFVFFRRLSVNRSPLHVSNFEPEVTGVRVGSKGLSPNGGVLGVFRVPWGRTSVNG